MNKRLKKILSTALLSTMALGLLAGCGNTEKPSEDKGKDLIKIGVIQSLEHGSLDAANKGFVDGLKEAGYEEGKNVTFVQQNAQNDQSNLQSIAQQFVSNKMDLIVAISTQSAQAVASATSDIPILGTAITDYETAKLVESNQRPGRNVSGTSDMNPIADQINLLKEAVPNLKTLGVIYSSSEANSLQQVEELRRVAKEKGLLLKEVTVSSVNDIQQVAKSLINEDIQAIYVPTDNTLASAMSNLVGITNEKKLPVMTGATAMTDDGGTIALGVDYYSLGKQTAEMAVRYLEGKAKIEDMPIETARNFEVVINQDSLNKIGLKLPASIMDQVKK